MDDLISRREAINVLCENCDDVQAVCPHFPCKRYTAIVALPSAQLTADVVEVVRCKDCEECDKDDLKKGHATVFCFHHGSYVPLRYFCGSGKRREK